jgi:hypothetical protein
MEICETKVKWFLKGNLGVKETHWVKRRHVGVKRELQMRMGLVWGEIRMVTNFEMEKRIR